MDWTKTRYHWLFLCGLASVALGPGDISSLIRTIASIHFHLTFSGPNVEATANSYPSTSCNDSIFVTLDLNCAADLVPEDVVDGSIEAYRDFYVKVLYPYQGYTINEVDRCGVFKYVVLEIVGGQDWQPGGHSGDAKLDREICWGYIYAEDKSPPIGCIRDVVALYRYAVPYDVHADYFLTEKLPKEIDNQFHRYVPVTYQSDKCQDQIRGKELLDQSQTELLICTDVDSIYGVAASWKDTSYAYFTGVPELLDNCEGSMPYLSEVVDTRLDVSCTDAKVSSPIPGMTIATVIERTFFIRDRKNNQSEITQKIYFFRPKIRLPDCKVNLSSCYFDDGSDLAPKSIASFPHAVSGAGMTMPIQGEFCNLSVSFTDLELEGPSTCGFKILRKWDFLDWCFQESVGEWTEPCASYLTFNEKRISWEQTLIVGESEAPSVRAPRIISNNKPQEYLQVTCQAMSCIADFEVPPPTVDNKCNYEWTVSVLTEQPILWHGIPTGEYEKVNRPDIEVTIVNPEEEEEEEATNKVFLGNIPKGFHHIVYHVQDYCGNRGTDTLPLLVLDEIPPVAICNEELYVAIGTGRESNGVGQLFAEDISEGSWDNCQDLEIKVRRFIVQDFVEEFTAISQIPLNPNPDTILTAVGKLQGSVGFWTEWFDYVDFVCADVRTNVLIEVGLWDNANGSTDSKGLPIYNDTIPFHPKYHNQVSDNFNGCWLLVLVEDKAPPACVAPKDIRLTCEELPYELDVPRPNQTWQQLTGSQRAAWNRWFADLDQQFSTSPQAFDNCSASIELLDVKFDLHCRSGEITRIFQATDRRGQKSDSCSQVLTLERVHNYCFSFPADQEIACGDQFDEDAIQLNSGGCDLLAISIQDEQFDVPLSDSGCYKIFRTYRVINWCQVEEDLDPDLPLFDQNIDLLPFVVGRDEDSDGIPGNEEIWVRFEGMEENGILQGTTYVGDDCHLTEEYYRSSHYSGGFYQYTQVLKVIDNEPPQIISPGENSFPYIGRMENSEESYPNGLSFDCSENIWQSVAIYDNCSVQDISLLQIIWFPDQQLGLANDIVLFENQRTTKEFPALSFEVDTEIQNDSLALSVHFNGAFPIGMHQLEIVASDACGNVKSFFLPLEVYDAKASAPICYSDLSVELTPVDSNQDGVIDQAMTTVWASDFLASENTDCSGALEYSIHRSDKIDRGEEVPDPSSKSLQVSCADPELLLIYVYSWDPLGNYDRCQAAIAINDFSGYCHQLATTTVFIAGKIMTESGQPAGEVQIDLSGLQPQSVNTDDTGRYVFKQLDKFNDYTILPYSNRNPHEGVTTFDLILISKFILGTAFFNSPYQIIAADVNNSQSVTALDIIHLRRFILHQVDNFPNNTSWRFIAAHYQFPEPTSPWTEVFPEVINYNDLAQDKIDANFIAIKIGDVNGDHQTEELLHWPNHDEWTIAPDLEPIQNLQLLQNFPNPFHEKTTVRFQLRKATFLTLEIKDASGITIKTIQGIYDKGLHSISLHLGSIPSGILFYSIRTSEETQIGSMVRLD